MNNKNISNDPLFSKEFKLKTFFQTLRGKTVLFHGLGGGCDVISAYSLASHVREILNDSEQCLKCIVATTKRSFSHDLKKIDNFIYQLPEKQIPIVKGSITYGGIIIEQSLPRMNGDPLIFILPKKNEKEDLEQLRESIKRLGIDYIVGVDTGGDCLTGGEDKDQRDVEMLALLNETGIPGMQIIFGPGCDGESSIYSMKTAIENLQCSNKYLGYFPLYAISKTLRKYSEPLADNRTPNLIWRAINNLLPIECEEYGVAMVKISRIYSNTIPLRWLQIGIAVDGLSR